MFNGKRKYKLTQSEKGRIVWRLLFGVIVASLLLGLLLVYYNSQQEAKAAGSAERLADSLSKACFAALSEGQIEYELPKSVGNSPYKLVIDEEKNFIEIVITGGDQKGSRYISSTDADLRALSINDSGGTLYITENNGEVIFSNEKIFPSNKIESERPTDRPPKFYRFAKENVKETAAICAGYFHAKNLYPEKERLDVRGFSWKGQNTLRIEITNEGKFLNTIEIRGRKTREKVGMVENSWVINQLETTDDRIHDLKPIPSLKNAKKQGWLYSPDQVLSYFQTRTWKRKTGKKSIQIPKDADIDCAATNTSVRAYPTFRINFEKRERDYTIYYQTVLWYYKEIEPGFVFQSKPELEVLT